MSAAPRETAPVWAVVLAFNEWDATRECLTSLRALDPAPHRTLLVDNGSTDSTPDRARAEFPEVEVLALGENRLFAGGVNAGLRRALEAGAASVLLLNNDVVLEREALLHLTAALAADPARGAVSPKLYFWDPPDRIWFAGGVVTKGFGLIRHRGIHKKDDAFRDAPRAIDTSRAAVPSPAARSRPLDSSIPSTITSRTSTGRRGRGRPDSRQYEPGARLAPRVEDERRRTHPAQGLHRLRSGAIYLTRHGSAWERPLAWMAYDP